MVLLSLYLMRSSSRQNFWSSLFFRLTRLSFTIIASRSVLEDGVAASEGFASAISVMRWRISIRVHPSGAVSPKERRCKVSSPRVKRSMMYGDRRNESIAEQVLREGKKLMQRFSVELPNPNTGWSSVSNARRRVSPYFCTFFFSNASIAATLPIVFVAPPSTTAIPASTAWAVVGSAAKALSLGCSDSAKNTKETCSVAVVEVGLLGLRLRLHDQGRLFWAVIPTSVGNWFRSSCATRAGEKSPLSAVITRLRSLLSSAASIKRYHPWMNPGSKELSSNWSMDSHVEVPSEAYFIISAAFSGVIVTLLRGGSLAAPASRSPKATGVTRSAAPSVRSHVVVPAGSFHLGLPVVRLHSSEGLANPKKGFTFPRHVIIHRFARPATGPFEVLPEEVGDFIDLRLPQRLPQVVKNMADTSCTRHFLCGFSRDESLGCSSQFRHQPRGCGVAEKLPASPFHTGTPSFVLSSVLMAVTREARRLYDYRPAQGTHLMLLTKNNAALRLLFEGGLLNHSKAEVMFGSTFPNDLSDMFVAMNLQRIKSFMQQPISLVMVHCDSLYESLYDLLNQHYMEYAGQRYVRIAHGSKAKQCPIHHLFRVIVITEISDAYFRLAPPLLNRFEKQIFLRKDLMSKSDEALLARVTKFWVTLNELMNAGKTLKDEDALEEASRAPTASGTMLNTASHRPIAGYHPELLSSLVFTLRKTHPNRSLDELVEVAKKAITWVLTPEQVRALQKGTSLSVPVDRNRAREHRTGGSIGPGKVPPNQKPARPKLKMPIIDAGTSGSWPEYCGRYGWTYWLATITILLGMLQLTYWTYAWVVRPIIVVIGALLQYVAGRGTWEAVLRGHGENPYHVRWTGPQGEHPWSVTYVQDQVRGRGEQQLPYDLLVTDGVAVARLRHGAVRGRTNRHGFLCRCDSVHGASHRYWRRCLERAQCVVHLCSVEPCTSPEAAELHITASSVVPQSVDVDLNELSGRGPMCRALNASKFMALQGVTGLWGTGRACGRWIASWCCCGGAKHSRNAIAWKEGTQTKRLSKERCKDEARKRSISRGAERARPHSQDVTPKRGTQTEAAELRGISSPPRLDGATSVAPFPGGDVSVEDQVLTGLTWEEIAGIPDEDLRKRAIFLKQRGAMPGPTSGGPDRSTSRTEAPDDSQALFAYMEARLQGKGHDSAVEVSAVHGIACDSPVNYRRRFLPVVRFGPGPSFLPPEQATRAFRAGAFTDAEAPAADETTKALQAIAKSLTSKEDALAQERGKLASIGLSELQLQPCTRDCLSSCRQSFGRQACSRKRISVGRKAQQLGGSFLASLLSIQLRKELFHALRIAGTQARPQLRKIEFPCSCNIQNRHSYGFAALQLGGKTLNTLPEYCLSAGDFPLTSEEDFDNYGGSPDLKLERKGRYPNTLTSWFRAALRQSWAFACLFGEEYYPVLEKAASHLLRLGEQHGYAWSASAVYGAWEELWARFCEEARELDRRIRRAMQDETPTFARLKFFALSPGPDGQPWLQLPGTFRLDDDTQYFCTDMLPRMQRQLSRACWAGAQKKGNTGGRAAGEGDATEARTEPGVPPPPKGGRAGGEAADKAAPPKLLGPSLTPKEAARSLDHRPKDQQGQYLCWDFLTHRGCNKGNGCPHSHKAAPKWTTLDYTVQLQLLRRGGLKGSKAKTGDEVDREFTRVRAEQAAKAAAAKQEGIAAAKAKVSATQRTNQAAGPGNADRASRAGERVPEQTGHVVADLDTVLPTDREETLGALLKDEGNNWWHDVDAAAATLTCPSSKFEKSARADAMRVVDAAEPALGPYPPGLVGVYLRNRLLRLREETGRAPELEDVTHLLEEAVSLGGPELSEEAAHLLEERGVHRKAGESPLVQLSGLTWNSSIGAGTLTWKGVGHWAMYDYQDQLPLSPEACERMGFADVRDEPKQCLLLHVAAAYLATPDQPLPTPEAVWALAAEWRVRWCSQARVAEDSLGPTPERLTQAEADVRVFHHDLLHFGHDRDYRTLVAHPLEEWDCLGLAVLRLDAYMRPSVEVVCGSRYSERQS
ncbi:rnf213a [Symbiodinium sp. CCMP2592]|nr:rnf213a [Symbiodinium sp. CCMP2592]